MSSPSTEDLLAYHEMRSTTGGIDDPEAAVLTSELETPIYRDDMDDGIGSDDDSDGNHNEQQGLIPLSTNYLPRKPFSPLNRIDIKLNAIIAGIIFLAILTSVLALLPRFESLLQKPAAPPPEQHWLIGVWSAYNYTQRRNIIRSTWQQLYTNSHPNIKTVFVLGRTPSSIWDPVLKLENDTYGDLVILDDLEESLYNANHFKNMFWFNHLRHTYGDNAWSFVSKVDDDSYVSAKEFYDTYIVPNLGHERLVIGRVIGGHVGFPYAGGQMYTFSYDLALHLAELHDERFRNVDKDEDLLSGWMLHEAGEEVDWLNLNNKAAFDINHEVEDPWSWDHQILEGAINPHKMKMDDDYLRVASMFNSDGVDLDRVREEYGHAESNRAWHLSGVGLEWYKDQVDGWFGTG